MYIEKRIVLIEYHHNNTCTNVRKKIIFHIRAAWNENKTQTKHENMQYVKHFISYFRNVVF